MNDEWETPDDLFNKLDDEFHFELDAAATEENCKVDAWGICLFNRKEEDGLLKNWKEEIYKEYQEFNPRYTVWLNPPYSRGNIDKFIKKAYEESLNGCTVVCLVRDDPSTNWYQKWVEGKATEVRRLARRVKFVGATSAYPFPCCVVVYKPPVRGSSGFPLQEYTNYYIWDWIGEPE